MSKREYTFTSANKGDVNVAIVGEYHDGCRDIEVSFGDWSDLHEERFDEIDDADLVMNWLAENGVKFESKRSALFNRYYIQSVMIDGDATETSLVAEIAAMDDAVIDRRYADLIAE